MIKFYIEHEDFVNGQINCNAGTAILGASVVSGISKIWGASKASKAQQAAAQQAASIAQKQYEQTRADFAPYRHLGEVGSSELEKRLPELTSDINLDEELAKNSTVKQAYDFTLEQGLKAVQNSAAKRGLGVSGAALKGATAFTTGLAKNTYQDLFNMERVNRTDAYTRLKGLVDTGQNAAAGTGTAGTAAAKQAGDALIGAGNAEAAKYNKMGDALSGIATNVGGWSYGAERGLYGNPIKSILNMPVDDVYF